MASYALLGALSGFRYSAVEKTLRLAPKLDADPFRVFLAAETGYGVIALEQGRVSVTLTEGTLEIKHLHVTSQGVSYDLDWDVTAQAGVPVQRELTG